MKETIYEALQVVEQCIKEAKGLENAAVELFKSQTSDLLTIAGPQWAAFVEEKAKLLSLMNELQEQYEALNRELSHRKGTFSVLKTIKTLHDFVRNKSTLQKKGIIPNH